MKKRVMIIDALNQFLRAYIVNPTLSTNGDPIGGTVGFLKIYKNFVEKLSQIESLFAGMAKAVVEKESL